MTELLHFISARVRFAARAEFEFINRLSQAMPNTMGLGLIPAMLIGWAALLACRFPGQHLVLGGFLALLVGPLSVFAFFFLVSLALAFVPRAAVVPVCAERSVLDSQIVDKR